MIPIEWLQQIMGAACIAACYSLVVFMAPKKKKPSPVTEVKEPKRRRTSKSGVEPETVEVKDGPTEAQKQSHMLSVLRYKSNPDKNRKGLGQDEAKDLLSVSVNLLL